MNPILNIWRHPRTSAAGVLISVATVAGVLGQQGVSIGHVGNGNFVTLASALATALLGLVAQDPGQSSQPSAGTATGAGSSANATAKLGAWMLIALLLPLPWLQECTASSVAQDIVNWTPSLESAVATVDSTAAVLAPSDATVFSTATTTFDAASNLLVAQAKAYLANPGATTLAALQNQVVTFQQQVNSALLPASQINNAASQQHAMASIQAVATIVNAMLSLVQSVSTKAAVAQMASQSTIKLAVVTPYLDREQSIRIVASHFNEPEGEAAVQVAQAELAEVHAGF